MERKRHIDATFDDVYSDLDGVQSKKSHFETDVTNQYLNGDEPEILSPNNEVTQYTANGDEDQDELDEFQFVDENPDMSEIQNSSHVTQSHVVTTTQGVAQVVTQADEDLAQVDEINFQNEKSGNQCYMEMPPAKNTIHQKSEYFDDSRQGKKVFPKISPKIFHKKIFTKNIHVKIEF